KLGIAQAAPKIGEGEPLAAAFAQMPLDEVIGRVAVCFAHRASSAIARNRTILRRLPRRGTPGALILARASPRQRSARRVRRPAARRPAAPPRPPDPAGDRASRAAARWDRARRATPHNRWR